MEPELENSTLVNFFKLNFRFKAVSTQKSLSKKLIDQKIDPTKDFGSDRF